MNTIRHIFEKVSGSMTANKILLTNTIISWITDRRSLLKVV